MFDALIFAAKLCGSDHRCAVKVNHCVREEISRRVDLACKASPGKEIKDKSGKVVGGSFCGGYMYDDDELESLASECFEKFYDK